MREFFIGTDENPVRIRVPGAQVGANKKDQGDRPCMLIQHEGREVLAHDVRWGDIIHGSTDSPAPAGRITQNFVTGCPVTGALIWLELVGFVVAEVRENTEDVRPSDWRVDADAAIFAKMAEGQPCVGCGGRH